MSTKKKTFFLISIISISAIIIVLFLLINYYKKQVVTSNSSNNTIDEEITAELKKVQNIEDIYNTEFIINNSLSDTYNMVIIDGDEYEEEDYKEIDKQINNEILEQLNIPSGRFYAEKVYSIKPNSNYIVYFVSGEILYNNLVDSDENNDNEEDIVEKMNAKFTVIQDTKTNLFGLELYGTNYENLFEYSEDIAKVSFDDETISNFKPVYELELNANDVELSDEELEEWEDERYEDYSFYFPEEADKYILSE